MLETHLQHFTDDITRARALLTHAGTQPAGRIHDDIVRSAWMFAVGAVDAYFSDAYASLVAKTLQAKETEPAVIIPDRLMNLKIPAVAVLTQAQGGWRWRMAARALIEDENVLSLTKIQQLFNQFFRKNHKLLNTDTIEPWVLHRDSKMRFFGISKTAYGALTPQQKGTEKKKALVHFDEHFEPIFQRRHDCIHNCDRPKAALQPITATATEKAVYDLEFLVSRCHEMFNSEYPIYLQNIGFNAVTRNRVTQ